MFSTAVAGRGMDMFSVAVAGRGMDGLCGVAVMHRIDLLRQSNVKQSCAAVAISLERRCSDLLRRGAAVYRHAVA